MITSLDIDWDLLGPEPLAVAVSGGADSFALLHACTERGLPVTALTVDHGLREGSAEDAAVVAAWCAGHSVPHERLAWGGEKPTTGVQAAARAARYRLLCEAYERLGLDRLATGHTLDDQAETVFMRLRRGAGRGLAGMPPSRKIASGPGEPITLLRPMLGVRREATRAYAEAHALPVREDPSNEDEGFERVRVRALLAALEQQGLLSAEALGRTAQAISTIGNEAQRSDEEVLGPDLHFLPAEETADVGLHDDDGGETCWHVGTKAAAWVSAVGGAAWMEEGDLRDLLGPSWTKPVRFRLFATDEPRSRKTAAGVLVAWTDPWNGVIMREPAALLGRADGTPGLAPVPAPPGSKHLYDRRFVVAVPGDVPEGIELRPLGQLLPRDVATSTLARSRVCTLPCLGVGDEITHLPAAAARAVWEALSGWKGHEDALPPRERTFEARSLLAERFANEVIRY